ncbi:MAG TPA: glycosyltransferase [Burkholderiaceae bacterium]
MPGADSPPDAESHDPLAGRRVVHVVGRLDAKGAEHLVAMTALLSLRGVPQSVVLFDDHRASLPPLDPAVRTVLASGPRWRMPRALLQALHQEVSRERIVAVHAHGLLPCLLGIFAARFLDLPAPLHVSFHRQPSPRLLERTVAMLWRTVAPPPAVALQDAPVLTEWTEPDVSDVFLESLHREARRPLVVTASAEPDPRHAARFVQLAVLLESSGLAFNWFGPVDAASAAQFAAAGVGHFDPRGDSERASSLRQAWLYVDFGGGHAAAAQRLAEAMASGLPCVTWHAAWHRELLEHDRTGLLCHSEEGLLESVAQLVDSAALRARLGGAAREEALKRFSPARRSDALIASYRSAAALRPAISTASPAPPLRLGRLAEADQSPAGGDPG